MSKEKADRRDHLTHTIAHGITNMEIAHKTYIEVVNKESQTVLLACEELRQMEEEDVD